MRTNTFGWVLRVVMIVWTLSMTIYGIFAASAVHRELQAERAAAASAEIPYGQAKIRELEALLSATIEQQFVGWVHGALGIAALYFILGRSEGRSDSAKEGAR